MGYWVSSVLAGEFPQPVLGQELISASTSPVNFGGLASYIDQYSGEFDAVAAGAGYAVPVPATASSYSYVQMIVGMGARAAALEEIYPNDNAKANRLRDAYYEALARISDHTLILSTPLDTSGTGRILGRYGLNAPPQIVASLGGARLGYPTDF